MGNRFMFACMIFSTGMLFAGKAEEDAPFFLLFTFAHCAWECGMLTVIPTSMRAQKEVSHLSLFPKRLFVSGILFTPG